MINLRATSTQLNYKLVSFKAKGSNNESFVCTVRSFCLEAGELQDELMNTILYSIT